MNRMQLITNGIVKENPVLVLLLLLVRRGLGLGFEGPQGFLMDAAGRLTHSTSPDVVTPFVNVGFGIMAPRVLEGAGYGIIDGCGGPGGPEEIAKAFQKEGWPTVPAIL